MQVKYNTPYINDFGSTFFSNKFNISGKCITDPNVKFNKKSVLISITDTNLINLLSESGIKINYNEKFNTYSVFVVIPKNSKPKKGDEINSRGMIKKFQNLKKETFYSLVLE